MFFDSSSDTVARGLSDLQFRGVFAFPLLAVSTAHSSRANTPALFQSTRNISLCTICGDNSSNACRLFSRNYFINHRRNIFSGFHTRNLEKNKGKYHKKGQFQRQILQEYGGGSNRHKEIVKSGLWSKRGQPGAQVG